MRVSTRGGMVCPSVTLYLEDLDWDCECPSPSDPCEHVAAATIALRRARKEGKILPDGAQAPGGEAGRLQYRFSRTETGGLFLDRHIVRGEESHPLKGSLSALSSGRIDGPKFMATPADLAVERALGPRSADPLSLGVLKALLPQLQRCNDILLDGKPISVAADPVGPHGVLEDQGEGFRLFVEEDPSIRERFSGGVVRCGNSLCFLNKGQLTGRELADLPKGRSFSADQALELVTTILPDLEERIPVEIRTKRLPTTRSTPPRIQLQMTHEGPNLAVLALLVYGDPPTARVDAGKLTPLGEGSIPIRDIPAEERLRGQLRQAIGLVPGRRVVLPTEEAIELSGRLQDFRLGPIAGEAHRDFFLTEELLPQVSMSDGDFELRFRTPGGAASGDIAPEGSGGAGFADPGEVLAAWRAGESLVPLREGGFAPLPTDWLQRFGAPIADLLAAKEAAGGKIPPSASPDLAHLCDELGLPRPEGSDRLLALAEDFQGIPEAPLPSHLNATLRHYQQDGVSWLCFLRDAGLGALLADDMGLGKTLQALCIMEGKTLVVAPTSVLHNWADEIERFRPDQKFCVYHGPARRLDPEAAITLTTYAILRLDIEVLGRREWDTVVLDEAQAIKNPDSQAAKAANQLQAHFRLALTGTPVENRLEELWSQMNFINPGFLGTRRHFDMRYAKPIGGGDQEAAAHLRQRLRPFLLRRLKREVAPELPPRTDMALYCELREEERALYDAINAATRAEVLAKLSAGGNVLEALEVLLRLRQAACHPALVPGQAEHHGSRDSSKLELLLDRLELVLADGHKALVFSQWTSFLDLVEPRLRASAVPFSRLDGSTRDRQAVVRGFQDTDGPPVLLVSLKAGGTGLNLTAADHIFLLDPWWNPAVEDQAADRAHRIGQDRPVMVYRLVAENTVEERILALQEKKRALSEAALSDTAAGATALGREDLLALLE